MYVCVFVCVCVCVCVCVLPSVPILFDKKMERGARRIEERRNERDQTNQGHDRHEERGNGEYEKIPYCLQL